MPSPVGHALAGLAAGWLFQPQPGRGGNGGWLFPVACAGLAIAPDLDLLLARHREATHSIAASLAVAVAAWLLLRPRTPAAGRLALACGVAYGSHVLLDWLGVDTSPPLGVAAWWPFWPVYYQAPWPVFPAISRRFHQPALFWWPNTLAVVRELLVLGPVVAASWYLHHRRRANRNAQRL